MRLRNLALSLVCIIFVLTVFVAFSYYRLATSMPSIGSDRVGLRSKKCFAMVLRDMNESYLRKLVEGADTLANELDILIDYKNLEGLGIKEQIETIESCIASRVDGIITTGCESKEVASVINKAIDKGIPVVTIRTDSVKSSRNTGITTNYYTAGVEAGKAIKERLSKGIKIGIITGDIDMLSVMGFKEIVDRYPASEIKMICSGGSDVLQVEGQMRDMLKQYPDIDVIYATGIMETVAVTRTVINLNRVDTISVVGFGDMPETIRYLKKGIILASVVESPFEMGYRSVKIMSEILSRKNVGWTIYTDTIVITPQTVREYEKNNLIIDK